MTLIRRRVVPVVSGAVLAALGSLVIHQFAYLLAFPATRHAGEALVEHGHMTTQWAIVTPLAIVMAVVAVLRQARQLGLTNPLRVSTLGSSAALLFVGQELVESFIAGRSVLEAFAQPALVLGVVVAPLVAWFIVRLLRQATILVGQLIAGPRRSAVGSPRVFSPVGQWLTPTAPLLSISSPRGPPNRFA